MPANLSSEAWAQIRHDYEHTDQPVEDICAEHGISATACGAGAGCGGGRRSRPKGRSARPPPQIEPAAPPLPSGRAFDPAAASPAAAPPIETAVPCRLDAPQVA